MKKSKSLLPLFTFSLCLFLASISRAETVPSLGRGAVVALFTPFAFFEKSLQSFMTTASTQDEASFPDQIVNVEGLNWHISGIKYQIHSEFTQGRLAADSYDIQSRNLKVLISIQRISVDQVLRTNQGGISLDVHVQAACAPIQLAQNSAIASARISYQFSPQSISTDVTQFNFQWPKQTWMISSLNCQGPSGINYKIQTALANNLQSADTLKPYIQNALALKIQDQVDNIVDQIKRPAPIIVPGSPLNLVLSFKQFQITKVGLLSYGQISWNGAPDPSRVTALGIDDVPPELVQATSPVLITSNQGWTHFIDAELDASPETAKVNLNQQKSFSDILKNKVLEFFLWPDLLNYTPATPFSLAIDTPKLNSLDWQSNGSAQVQISPSAWMQVTRQNKLWNYIKLYGQARASISPQIIDGKFKVIARIQNSSIHYQYGSEYVNQFGPNQFISPLIINQLSKNLETSFVFSNSLPSFDLGPIGVARFNGWVPIHSGTHIAIPVQIIPPIL